MSLYLKTLASANRVYEIGARIEFRQLMARLGCKLKLEKTNVPNK